MKQITRKIKQGAKELAISNKEIKDGEIQYLCSQSTQKLSKIWFPMNKITTQGMLHISKAVWRNLTELNLQRNLIEAKGCKYLTQATLDNLQCLNLNSNKIGSEGVLHLSKGNWKKLKEIELYMIRIRPNGIGRFLRGDWNKIKSIGIGENNLLVVRIHDLVLCSYKSIDRLVVCCQSSLKKNSNIFAIEQSKVLSQKFPKASVVIHSLN